jgi:hypothetical protein
VARYLPLPYIISEKITQTLTPLPILPLHARSPFSLFPGAAHSSLLSSSVLVFSLPLLGSPVPHYPLP